jgi:hypothetical protein
MAMGVRMKPFRVSVVQCRGTPYEVGRAQARLFAMTPKGRAFLRNRTRKLPWWFNIRTEQRMFAKFAPVVWEELAGIADELDIAMEQAAFRFGNDSMRPPIGACSAAMIADVYGRNYDNRPRYYAAHLPKKDLRDKICQERKSRTRSPRHSGSPALRRPSINI